MDCCMFDERPKLLQDRESLLELPAVKEIVPKNGWCHSSREGLGFMASAPGCPEGYKIMATIGLIGTTKKHGKLWFVYMLDYDPLNLYNTKPQYWGSSELMTEEQMYAF